MDFLFLMTVFPAYLVGTFFIRHDPGPEEPKQAIYKGVWFGVLAVVLAIGLSFLLDGILEGDFEARAQGLESGSQLPLFLDVLLFATIEEFVKFVPIAAYLIKKDYFNEHTDGIIYFALVGLTFGAIESFLYGLGFGEVGVFVAISRLVLGLFFHAALTSLVGYFFVRAKLQRQGMATSVLMLLVASLIHALYNYFVFLAVDDTVFIAGAALVALATNILMFWLYYQATKHDIAAGLAGPHTKTAAQPTQDLFQHTPDGRQ